MIQIICDHDYRGVGTGMVGLRNGMSFIFTYAACADCIPIQLAALAKVEMSITRVNPKDVSYLNRCFDSQGNEEMFQIAKNNFEYWNDEINCQPFEPECDCGCI